MFLFFQVKFAKTVVPTAVNIHHMSGYGSVVTVEGKLDDGNWTTLWEDTTGIQTIIEPLTAVFSPAIQVNFHSQL